MKKFIFLLSLMLLCSQNSVYSTINEQITEQRGFISTNAEKTKEVYPNIAEITFTKESTAKTIELASNENKIVISKINKILETFKVNNPNSIEIKTGSYTVRPNYSYKNNKNQITGYTIINSITVKTKQTEIIGKMIDSALNAGADRVGSLSFSYENDGTICRDLISEATKEAQKTAITTAKSANQEIKGIKSISTGCYTQMNNSSVLRNYSAKAIQTDSTAESIETTITPGKIKIRASVNADFYVK